MYKKIIILFRNNEPFHVFYVNDLVKMDYVDKLNQAYEMKERIKKRDLEINEKYIYGIKIFYGSEYI